jgi:AmmeMemoRadiSam system protein B
MVVRIPARAGLFYERSPAACRRHAEKLLAAAEPPDDLPAERLGGIVPHAGWAYSGRVAALTLRALLEAPTAPQTVVLFGADHAGAAEQAEVYDAGAWGSPLGELAIDEELAAAVLAEPGFRANPGAHDFEHSLEVQVPLLAVLAPRVRILPITVPADARAPRIGQAVARAVAGSAGRAAIVGSTDLTHHGGHFGNPGGRGVASEAFTRQNDFRMIELLESMDAEAVISEAGRHHNACGAGAAAAAVAACRQLGATRGRVLDYTNSYVITHEEFPAEPDGTTVGYASVVFV